MAEEFLKLQSRSSPNPSQQCHLKLLTSRRAISMESTAIKSVCAKNQWATNTTIANAQNWRTAPTEKNAITPRMALYDTTLSVLDVPARLNPSAIRCFTDRVTEVFPTAFTKLNMFSAPTNTITIGSTSLHPRL